MFVEPGCWRLGEWIAHDRWWPTTFGSWSILDEDVLGICQKLAAGQPCLAGQCTRLRELNQPWSKEGPKQLSEVQCQWDFIVPNISGLWIREDDAHLRGYWEHSVRWCMSNTSWMVVLFFSVSSLMLPGDHFRASLLEIWREGAKFSHFQSLRSLQLFHHSGWGLLRHTLRSHMSLGAFEFTFPRWGSERSLPRALDPLLSDLLPGS